MAEAAQAHFAAARPATPLASPGASPAAIHKPSNLSPRQHAVHGVDVDAAVAAMAAAVQRGDFSEAEAVGAAAAVNLALPKTALRNYQPLSEGAQAAVYSAELSPACLVSTLGGPQVLSGGGGDSLAVAVKKPRIRETADLQRFRREAALLAQLRHPHIVQLLGARLLPPDYLLVLQLEDTNAAAELHAAGWRPTWRQLAPVAAQLAAAVAHVHAAGYVHRDIKPANLLLDRACSAAKLADLGLAASVAELESGAVHHAKPTGGFHKQHMVGTLEYMAPEVLLGRPHSQSADVFAVAVTVNEMAAGQVPYSDCTRDNPLAHTVLEMGYGRQELAAAVAAEGLRPTMQPDTPPNLQHLLLACWQRDPALRPTAADVARQLAGMAASEAAAAAVEVAAAEQRGAGGGRLPQLMTPQPPAALPLPALLHSKQQVGSSSKAGLGSSRPDGGGSTQVVPQVHVYADVAMTDADSDNLDADLPHVGSSGCSSSPGSSRAGSVTGGFPPWLAPAGLPQGQYSAGQGGSTAVHVGTFLTAGKRDAMEDTVAVLHDAFAAVGAPGCTALGVFDGHRGASAALYLTASLQQHLTARLGSSSGGGAQLLAGALLDADVAYRAQQDAEWRLRVARMGPAAGQQPSPGATATLLLLYPGAQQGQQQEQQQGQQQQQLMLAVANLGDSRVVLCRDGQAVQLTRDHTADLPDERQRVAAAGGVCSVRAGGWRVGDAGLQVTRSVGDADLKAQGVTAEAETAEVALTAGDSFLIAATDGLWDRLSNDDAVALVQDTVKHPAMCAQRLVMEALARGSGDNTSCIVAFLGTASTAERVYHAGRLKYGGAASTKRAVTDVSADEMRETY